MVGVSVPVSLWAQYGQKTALSGTDFPQLEQNGVGAPAGLDCARLEIKVWRARPEVVRLLWSLIVGQLVACQLCVIIGGVCCECLRV